MKHFQQFVGLIPLSLAAALAVTSFLESSGESPPLEPPADRQTKRTHKIFNLRDSQPHSNEIAVAPEKLAGWLQSVVADANPTTGAVEFDLGSTTGIRGQLVNTDGQSDAIVQGTISAPSPGTFFFMKDLSYGVAYAKDGSFAYRITAKDSDAQPQLAATSMSKVVCHSNGTAGIPEVPADLIDDSPPEALHPEDHPVTNNPPAYQNGVPALESNPGAVGVLYIDFDGGVNSDVFWGTFNVEHSGKNAAQVRSIWVRVAEDFIPFDVNVTTDLAVYEAAATGQRQKCWVTNTRDAIGNAGGIAVLNSYKLPQDIACWALPYGDDNCAIVTSHEFGHTLALGHDGNSGSAYSRGFGSGVEGWCPQMGAAYGKVLSIWSVGDYPDANNTQDDLTLIAANPGIGDRQDLIGNTIGDAEILRAFADETYFEKEVIENRTDLDVYTFRTTGGSYTIEIKGADRAPNLNIEGTLLDSTGAVVQSQNSPSDRNVSMSGTLAAGDYYIQVDGAAREGVANPFSDYGILGGFSLSGTISGLIAPQLFGVDEGTPISTIVGTVVPWETHTAPTFTVTGGDTANLFTLNPATGELSVSNSIDYEALYSDYRFPPEYRLRVLITSTGVTEERTVFVFIRDVNEPPTIASTFDETILNGTAAGTAIGSVRAEDPSPFQSITYAITAGDLDGNFAIDPDNGLVTTAVDIELSPQTFNLTITATDSGEPASDVTAPVNISIIDAPAGLIPGTLTQLLYHDIPGNSMASLSGANTYPHCPDQLDFPGDAKFVGYEQDFGAVMKGLFIAPETGTYQFWIAADDVGELYLSSDDDPANALLRASVLTATAQESFDELPSQASAPIVLAGGVAYYIEARMKQGDDGTSHLSIGWQRPLRDREILPQRYLAPMIENYPPSVRPRTVNVRENAIAGAYIANLGAVDPNVGDTVDAYAITSGNAGSVFGVESNGDLRVLDPSGLPSAGGAVIIGVSATDNHSASCDSTIEVSVLAADAIVPGIKRELWFAIDGMFLSSLFSDPRYPCAPQEVRTLTELKAGNIGEQYGSRIRVWLTPSVTGTYRLYSSGDDECRLIFGADATSSTPVAGNISWTNAEEWDKYPTEQESAEITLTAGTPYYLEYLQKEGGGGDGWAIGWKPPGATDPAVIPIANVSPYDLNCPPTLASVPAQAVQHHTTVGSNVVTLNGSDPEGETLSYGITSGNGSGIFAIDPGTGAISVANDPAPGVYQLSVVVQDGGRSGDFPLASATRVFDITVNRTLPGEERDWRSENFTQVDLDDPTKESTVWGRAANPDSDPWSNFEEFAFGGDPNDDTSTLDQTLTWTYDSVSDQFTATFPRLVIGLLDYELLFSGDLQTWTAAAAGENVATPIDARYETASFTETSDTATERRRFVTVSVSDPASADPATVLTDAACGYYHFKPPSGSSAWTAGLVKPRSHAGTIDGISGSVLTESSGSFAADELVGSYVEILLPSPHAGAIFDITENTPTTITVEGDLDAYGLIGDENFAVREHVTLGELLPAGGGLQPPSDSLTLYYDDGSSKTFLLVDLGGGDLNWFLPPSDLANGELVYPGQGFVIQADAQRDLLIGQAGVAKVKSTPTVIPLFASATNFVGLVNPLVSEDPAAPSVVRLADTGLLDSLEASTTSTFSDESATLFTRSGGQLDSAGTFFTFDDGSGAFFYIPPATLADDEPVEIGSAFSIDVRTDKLYRQEFQLPQP